ncbi:hypothetical protein EZS27_013645 [termite gut metagenome]|uniref:Uncharacterized protein n=1 Tax=termite gut metagenome TaxID=433724 RepID=A0A5J4RWM3_9ZZZZ
MESKNLIHRDIPAIEEAVKGYAIAQKQLQIVVDYLKSVGVEATFDLLKDIINQGGKVVEALNKKSSREKQGLSISLQNVIDEDTQRIYGEIKRLGENASKATVNSLSHAIDLDLFYISEGNVSLLPDSKERIGDKYSVYIDSPEREDIYIKAQNVVTAISELKKSIDKADKKGLVGKLLPILPSTYSGARILSVDADGETEITGESFGFIK